MREIALSKDAFKRNLHDVAEQILAKSFTFQIKKVNEYYLTQPLTHKMVLRKLNDNIRRIYKDKQGNRNTIVSQVKTLLEETYPMWILKTDIKGFYESIERDYLLKKLQSDSMLSFHSQFLMKQLFSNEPISTCTGLPKGMNISATLSEIYMRDIDKWLSRTSGVYYYARFVDDIIIFAFDKDIITNLRHEIEVKLKTMNMQINQDKTSVFNGDDIKENAPLEYLGYRFSTSMRKKGKRVKISIAKKKVNKIKTRIILSFLDHFKNHNFKLLRSRIKFLTSNFKLRETEEGNSLKAGIYYNYPQVNNCRVFDELNTFLRKITHSKANSFGANILRTLTTLQRENLSKYSFKYGFQKKVCNSFKPEEIKKIESCWP